MKSILVSFLFTFLLTACSDNTQQLHISDVIKKEAHLIYSGELTEGKIKQLQDISKKESLKVYKSERIQNVKTKSNISAKSLAAILSSSKLNKISILDIGFIDDHTARAVVAYHITYDNFGYVKTRVKKSTIDLEKIEGKWYLTKSLGNKTFS